MTNNWIGNLRNIRISTKPHRKNSPTEYISKLRFGSFLSSFYFQLFCLRWDLWHRNRILIVYVYECFQEELDLISSFFFLQFLKTILILRRINDVLEQQFKHTYRQTQKEENSLEQHPPKEVGLRFHSMKAKTKSLPSSFVLGTSSILKGFYRSISLLDIVL